MPEQNLKPTQDQQWRYWYWAGVKRIASVPALILILIFVGYAITAREMGLSLGLMLFIGLFIWAIPSQVLLLSAIASNLSVFSTALTIAFASMRFLPSVAALLPVIRDKKTRFWELFIISHFAAAVTAWVFAMTEAPQVPRPYRAAFVLGFSSTLGLSASVVFAALAYHSVAHLPMIFSGMIVFLIPVYFLCSMTGSAKNASDLWAMGLGLGIGVLLLYWIPEYAMLITGLVGGTLAYWIGRMLRKRTATTSTPNKQPAE